MSIPQPSAAPFEPVQLGPARALPKQWKDVWLTARFCGVTGRTKFVDGKAIASSTTYGQVTLYVARTTIGQMAAPEGELAAVSVDCNNGGGTAAGDLARAYVLIAVRQGQLYSVGEITPQARAGDGRAQSVSWVRIGKRSVLAEETWYRPEDGTCCYSGRAVTTWVFDGDSFRPTTTHLTA